MKKWVAVGLAILIVFAIGIGIICADVRINEVMYDPNQCSSDSCEYIEIYSPTPISLINWEINATNQKTYFNYSLDDFLIITKNKAIFLESWSINESKIIEWTSLSLLNSGEGIYLFNGSQLISNVSYSSSWGASDNGKSLQLCDGSWLEQNPTPGESNNCTTSQNATCTANCAGKTCGDNGCGGSCGTCSSGYSCSSGSCVANTNSSEDEIYIDLDWDADYIINGKEFEIELDLENLESKDYDVKIYIYKNSANNPISEIYNEETEDWQSSYNYISEIISGSGDKTKTFNLSIKEAERDFSGYANISAKIRDSSGDIFESEIFRIEILEADNQDEEDSAETSTVLQPSSSSDTSAEGSKTIRLGGANSSDSGNELNSPEENSIIYKSTNEYIREYAVYGFSILCVAIIILLLMNKVGDK